MRIFISARHFKPKKKNGQRPVSSRRLDALPVGNLKIVSSGRCRFFVDYVAKRPYLKYPERQQV